MSHQILSRLFSRHLVHWKEFTTPLCFQKKTLVVRHLSINGRRLGGSNCNKSRQQNVMLASGLALGGGVTLATIAYRRNLSALRSSLNGTCIPSVFLKRSFCAQASDVSTKDPLPGWSPEAQDLYHRYMTELLPNGWKKVLTTVGRERNQALYTLNHPDVGAVFEYAMFYKEEEQKSIMLLQFGPKTQGPPGFVHGGAIATVGDTCAGIHLGAGMHIVCVTASLTVNYKRPIPLGTSVVVETTVEKIEGRKYFTLSTIKSPDGSIVYDTVHCLYIQISKPLKK